MRRHPTAPILEFDPTRRAIANPKIRRARGVPPHCVVSFFKEDLARRRRTARRVGHTESEAAVHPLHVTRFGGRPVAFFHPSVGAPLAGALLEEMIGFGCRKFIAVGCAGALQTGMPPGTLIVPHAAVRDEGFSYHYLPAAREVRPHPHAVRAIERILSRRRLPFRTGKTWTTDAFYRETRDKVAARRAAGCLTVEMEAAAFFAVAKFRRVVFGQILYVWDDLSSGDWKVHAFPSEEQLRARLFDLAAEAVLSL